ncbi:MAG: ROK family protein [Candidatus Caldarchaeum sp.]
MKTIAVDLGATYTRFGLLRDGVILKKIVFRTPTTRKGLTSVFGQAFKIMHQSGASERAAVGIASIGPLSVRKGVVMKTPNIGWLGINLRDIVERFHRKEPVILNDCTAAALAEKIYGRWRGCDNLVFVSISTGIGGGAVVDGHLLQGKDGNAVEIGHIVVDYGSDVRCGCGGRGHWEALCSATGLPKLAAKIHGKKLWNDPREIFSAAKKGDRRAVLVISKMAELNAAGFASVINSFDPEIVVVGGGVAISHPRETVLKAERHMKKYLTLRAKVAMTSLGPDGPLLGAGAAAAGSLEK